jgi:hypothetical protein
MFSLLKGSILENGPYMRGKYVLPTEGGSISLKNSSKRVVKNHPCAVK